MVSLVTKFSVFIAFLFVPFSAVAAPGDHRAHPYVVDPDTVDLGLAALVRIIGVDGPEKGRRASCATERAIERRATVYARTWIDAADQVTFLPALEPSAVPGLGPQVRRDQYGRFLGDLDVDGEVYSKVMMAAGYLRRWDYDGCGQSCRPDWCAE